MDASTVALVIIEDMTDDPEVDTAITSGIDEPSDADAADVPVLRGIGMLSPAKISALHTWALEKNS